MKRHKGKKPSGRNQRSEQQRRKKQKQKKQQKKKQNQNQHQKVKRRVIPPYAREELEERWRRAGIENDYIFSVVMQDPEIFLQLMQNLPSLRRRTRYYQSMIDIQNLKPREDYRELPDSFVIMICPFDLFGKGRHLYRFRNMDIYDRSLELGDGAEKIFLNANGTADDISRELKNFLEYVSGKAPADAYCEQVAESVYEAKNSVEVKRMFMNVNLKEMETRYYDRKEARAEGLAEGRAVGLAEGRAEEQENSLRKMCNFVAKGKLSIADAVESAADYGIFNETDLRERAHLLGINL